LLKKLLESFPEVLTEEYPLLKKAIGGPRDINTAYELAKDLTVAKNDSSRTVTCMILKIIVVLCYRKSKAIPVTGFGGL
jgi:hypothetical protein